MCPILSPFLGKFIFKDFSCIINSEEKHSKEKLFPNIFHFQRFFSIFIWDINILVEYLWILGAKTQKFMYKSID